MGNCYWKHVILCKVSRELENSFIDIIIKIIDKQLGDKFAMIIDNLYSLCHVLPSKIL